MKTADFNFELPERLIAQHPCERRGESRLLVLDRAKSMGAESMGDCSHSMVADLADFVPRGTVMVFNDSRVRKARLLGRALDSGAEVEFLLLEPLVSAAATGLSVANATLAAGAGMGAAAGPSGIVTGRLWRALCSKTKRQRPGRLFEFAGGLRGRIVEEQGDQRLIEFDPPADEAYLEHYGHMPLPPYIRREDQAADQERYQTIYARAIGSAAAPTAGLHFTQELFARLDERGIQRTTVTLHVGLGTFLPVRTDSVEEHRMHEECYTVPEATAAAVNAAKKEGRSVLAVGTTSLRTLESAWRDQGKSGKKLAAGSGSTSIFIYPGYTFQVVDMLFTNFHTPKSTLLMLVSAFAGRERILAAYNEAVSRRYRFFSYGDAMLIR